VKIWETTFKTVFKKADVLLAFARSERAPRRILVVGRNERTAFATSSTWL